MIDQTETQVRIERLVDVGADALFAVLSDPRRHPEIDGSGTVRASAGTEAITAVGQVFTMQMSHPDRGEYQSDNLVTHFEAGHRLVWMTARAGNTPPGWLWSWDLEPLGPDRTNVVHIYNWEKVEDPEVLARAGFPRVSAAEMNATVTRLAAAAAG
jgi:uncharacterized protein YndB with AHSA1/START domain